MKSVVNVWFRNNNYMATLFKLSDEVDLDNVKEIGAWTYTIEPKVKTMLLKVLGNGKSHKGIIDL